MKERLDTKLSSQFALTRQKARTLIEESAVNVNNKTITKPSFQVGEEDVIEITKTIMQAPSNLKHSDLELDVIFEDEHLMVINKQAGVSTHPPSIHGEGTIANAVVNIFNEEGTRPGIVHRLDKETTGLLIIAKTEGAKLALSQMIEKREVKRSYLALVFGSFKFPEFQIKTNIIRDARNRLKMRVAKTAGKHAVTNVLVKQVLLGGAVTLAELVLETGRTHQIRVHLEHMKTSVVGEQTYGNKPPSFFTKFAGVPEVAEGLQSVKRQMLHAFSLKFKHPFTEEELELLAPLPKDFAELLEILKKY